MRWLLVALFTTAAALAAGQNAPSLPEGDGKALVTGACASCHGLDLITAKQATRDEWSGVIERMKSYGMAMDTKETTIVVDYLTKNFGPKTATPPPTPTPAPAPAPAPQEDPAADAAGKALVDGMCASCHGVDLITDKQATRVEWQGTIDRMKTYGLAIDEKQNATLLDYLVRKYGPKQATAAPTTPAATTAAAADPGKALLDAFCSNCHDLDLVSGRTATQAEWQDIVDRMNGRGAGVPEKDIPAMVAYLAKTYPVKK